MQTSFMARHVATFVLGLPILALSLLARPVQAEDKILVADCTETGCRCSLSAVTLVEYETVVGSPAPPGAAEMVLVMEGTDFSWSRSSPDQIDAAHGGAGLCPIELFSVIPKDGTWRGTVRMQEITGCLPQVAEMVPQLVDGTQMHKQIVWGGKFHPSQFVMGDAPDRFLWTQRSPTQFDGVFPVPANDTLKISIITTATLTTSDRAEATVSLHLAAAQGANAAALAVLGMADCRANAIYDFERVGP